MHFPTITKQSFRMGALVLALSSFSFSFTACDEESAEMFTSSLNEYLTAMKSIEAEMPAVVEPTVESVENDTTDEYYYHTEYYQAAAGYDEQMVLNPQTDVIYPGALVKGESILDGTYTLIAAKRKPITISTSLLGGANASIEVQDPKLSTIREAVNALMKQEYDVPYANMSFTIEQANSEQQLDLSLRASYKGGSVNVKGGFDFSNKKVKTRLIAKFIQSYYTLDMDLPNQPSDLFEADVDRKLFGSFMPMYVSTVTFGRMALFTIESELSELEVRTFLNASYANVKGSASADFNSLQAKSTMKVYILGGSGADASGTINGFEDFKKYITEGGNFSKTSPGAPVSYKLRYINDNKIGKIVFAARYPIVTAIPRTDNVVYDIKALMANMKLNISDAGGNAELYGNVKCWPASLGEGAAHTHFNRSSGNYMDFSEKANHTFPVNTETEKEWTDLKADDKIIVRIDMKEADTGSDDSFGASNFEIPVSEIITSVEQGFFEKTGMKVYSGTQSIDFTFKFTPTMRRIK
ncbi:MAG: thiol-activated cytolysin family protein [Paludibacteraceae bacterium]|nr:thiol-activated cytolysin family protein [Paludibacteraceae bacterium]